MLTRLSPLHCLSMDVCGRKSGIRCLVLEFSRRRVLVLAAPSVAVLELLHPTWPDEAVFQTVAPIVGWWLTVHVLLLVLLPAVLWTLWLELPPSRAGLDAVTRVLLIVAAVANAAFIAIDGLGTGVLIITARSAALIEMWNSPLLIALADLAGAAFALALLTTAAALYREARTGVALIGLVVTGLAFLASALPNPSVSPALLLSRIAALVAGGVVVYQGGGSRIPFALLVFAAVLPQHVGPPAALGVLLIGAALLLRERSSPAAECPP